MSEKDFDTSERLPQVPNVYQLAIRQLLEQLSKRNLRLRWLKAEQGQLAHLVAEKEQAVQVLTAQVAEKEQAVQALTAHVAEKEQAVQALTAQVAEKEQAVQALTAQVAQKEQTVQALTAQVVAITHSTGWGLLQVLWRLRVWVAPRGSLRERVLRLGMRALRVWRREGFRTLVSRGRRKVGALVLRFQGWLFDKGRAVLPYDMRRTVLKERVSASRKLNPKEQAVQALTAQVAEKEQAVQALTAQVAEKEQAVQALTAQVAEDDWPDIANFTVADKELAWGDYRTLSEKISDTRRTKLANIHLTPPKMISVEESQLVAHAKSLRFPSVERPQVSIIIPVYNNTRLTVECLTSILRNTGEMSYEIIVIDDGSTDRTPEILSHVGNITYLRSPERLGFVLSCKTAGEKARGEFLLFLNNDVQVTEGWLQRLVEMFSRYENIGAVGPKILFPDGRLQEAGARINQDASSQLIGVFDDPELPRYNYIREVDYCSGVCLLVPTALFRELGGFDVSYAPAYCEDVDLCMRIRKRGMRILYNPESVIVHHLSATSNSLAPTFKLRLVVQNQQKLSEKWQEQIDELNRIKLIAFYLPQYHPIPENDRWWCKGFTDWNNITKARPNFVGHYQPHLPSDLGFYDLRVEEVMEQQAELAKRYGIYGFCFYYYWFHGKRLLELPIERMLECGKPNIPFCLCWANENWTRRWDGREDQILIAQHHSDNDDRAVIDDIMRHMQHPHYIRINGKPLLLVYRVDHFPNIKRTATIWRDVCRKQGIGEIYLAMVEVFQHVFANRNPSEYGFDASVEFPPHETPAVIEPPGRVLNPDYVGVVSDYRKIVLKYLERELPSHVRFRTVMPCWDNTPRQQNDSFVFAYASPGAYHAWLETVLQLTREQNFGAERIVFINAWNEWAEGAHLEPDQRFGHGFLEATRNALDRALL